MTSVFDTPEKIHCIYDLKGSLVGRKVKDKERESNPGAVLKDVNFEINKNETVAFVGESGSGKSTLVNLLTGLLTPNTGNIYIDEISLEKYNLKTFQTKVGYITQDPVIFDDTVFNNVTLWDTKNEINLAKYQEALKQASIWEYFQNTEHQENTRLGNKGVRLSGGQIQRICIARELYKNVDFLFMDEATSALDSKTENIVKKNIESLQGFVTIIIVAHRLSTIKHADKIIVMNKGNVEAIGKFDELLEKSELFKSMINLQELRN
jgi:subfamily B ATP-binding cassette protein MsbA